MTFRFDNETMTLVSDTYVDGNLCVSVHDEAGDTYARISCNLPESNDLPKDAFYLKDWSENRLIAQALFDHDLLIPVDAPVAYPGFVVAYAYRLAR